MKNFTELIEFAKKKFLLSLITGITTGIKYAVFLITISRSELSRVSPLSSLSTLVALYLARIFLKENPEKRWWAAILMVVGAGLLAYKM